MMNASSIFQSPEEKALLALGSEVLFVPHPLGIWGTCRLASSSAVRVLASLRRRNGFRLLFTTQQYLVDFWRALSYSAIKRNTTKPNQTETKHHIMNNWDCSPITQTNEVARKFTPKDDTSPLDSKPLSKELKQQLLAEDLQKIRRSNHSAHQQHRQDAMDDDEHDGIIKGLLYPGLEDSTNDCDFFEEDYHSAQEAVRLGSTTTNAERRGTSNYVHADDNHAIHRRSTFDAFSSMSDQIDSYETSYFASMGRPYSDLSQQKLRR